MPLITIKKNIEKKLVPHLYEDEELLAILMAGTMKRCAMGLTDTKRIIITSFPLIGESTIVGIHPVDEIEEIDYFLDTTCISFILRILDHTTIYKLPLSGSRFHLANELQTFFTQVIEWNERARPKYLRKNEKIIETIRTKQGVIKLTNENIFLFSHSRETKSGWEINEKIPISSIQEFDYYPEDPGSLMLYVENEEGESRVYVIGRTAILLEEPGSTANTDTIIKKIYDSLSENKYNPAPSYLFDDEEVITTLRVNENRSRGKQAEVILRLTSRRFLVLTNDKRGKLVIKSEIGLETINNASLIREESPGGSGDALFVLRLKTEDGRRSEYWINETYWYSIEKIDQKIKEYGYTCEQGND
jgi:hypothetical protein